MNDKIYIFFHISFTVLHSHIHLKEQPTVFNQRSGLVPDLFGLFSVLFYFGCCIIFIKYIINSLVKRNIRFTCVSVQKWGAFV